MRCSLAPGASCQPDRLSGLYRITSSYRRILRIMTVNGFQPVSMPHNSDTTISAAMLCPYVLSHQTQRMVSFARVFISDPLCPPRAPYADITFPFLAMENKMLNPEGPLNEFQNYSLSKKLRSLYTNMVALHYRKSFRIRLLLHIHPHSNNPVLFVSSLKKYKFNILGIGKCFQ